MKNSRITTSFIVCLCFFVQINGQDGHYWTQQYGTRSMLLSGSVIGGVEDLGAVYYNPARLSQIDNPAFILSADVYEVNNIEIKDAFGDNISSKRRDIRGVPSLAAGTFKLPFLEKHSFAWAILLRSDGNLGFSYKNEVYDDVIGEYPGNEYFGAEASLTQKSNDQWTGLNWSYPITDKLSVGMSGFLSLVSQNKGMQVNLQAYTDSNETASYRFNRNVSFEQYSFIGKLGFSYIHKYFTAGLTFLTPRYYLKGKGGYNYEEFFSGIHNQSDENDRYISSYQSDIKINYQSSYAMGGGVSIHVKKSKIHLSSEWYSPLTHYTIMEADNYIGQSSGDTLGFKLIDELHSVVNFGIGVELYLNDKVSGYVSACTDYSGVATNISRFFENEPVASNSIFQADYYHFGGGVVMHFKVADITLGGTYTGANQQFNRPINFPDNAGEKIFDSNDKATLSWDRFRLVFSFSVPFIADVQKKVEDKLGF